MSKSNKEEKMVMLKPLTLRKLMIAYVRCMMFSDVINLLLLRISDHIQDKEHADAVDGMDGPLMIKE